MLFAMQQIILKQKSVKCIWNDHATYIYVYIYTLFSLSNFILNDYLLNQMFIYWFSKGLNEKWFFVSDVDFEKLLKVMSFSNVFENVEKCNVLLMSMFFAFLSQRKRRVTLGKGAHSDSAPGFLGFLIGFYGTSWGEPWK